MVTIELGDPLPADGEIEIMRDGKYIAAVVRHPRMDGFWLACMPPRTSGCWLKRFGTRSGAVRYIQRLVEIRHD